MKIVRCLFAGMLSFSWPWQIARAAEISVPPGDGTLAAAIASASEGDTLILMDGLFSGDVTLSKSLTMRPLDRTTDAVVFGSMVVEGEAISVTLQGLTFTESIVVKQAASVRILENLWTSGGVDVTEYRTSEGDGALTIVGNQINAGSIEIISSENAYIAGNVLSQGRIVSQTSCWIVGNEVVSGSNNYDLLGISAAGDRVYVLANRVQCLTPYSSKCIDSSASFSLIASNIVLIENWTSPYKPNSHRTGVHVSGPGASSVINNVVRGPNNDHEVGVAVGTSNKSVRVSGNIVIDYHGTGWRGSPALPNPTPGIEVTHNLCWNSGDCPSGDGNLELDPQFIDLIDFKLASNSPAIDAGPPDYRWADLDRTRNDMGAHGGPWSIGQYDAKRNPNSLAPFVYPLFKADSSIFNGKLEVEALGVARLR